jgi:hypothetical protein
MIIMIPHDAAQVRYQCLWVQSASNFVARIVDVKVEYTEYYTGDYLIVLVYTH